MTNHHARTRDGRYRQPSSPSSPAAAAIAGIVVVALALPLFAVLAGVAVRIFRTLAGL